MFFLMIQQNVMISLLAQQIVMFFLMIKKLPEIKKVKKKFWQNLKSSIFFLTKKIPKKSKQSSKKVSTFLSQYFQTFGFGEAPFTYSVK